MLRKRQPGETAHLLAPGDVGLPVLLVLGLLPWVALLILILVLVIAVVALALLCLQPTSQQLEASSATLVRLQHFYPAPCPHSNPTSL